MLHFNSGQRTSALLLDGHVLDMSHFNEKKASPFPFHASPLQAVRLPASELSCPLEQIPVQQHEWRMHLVVSEGQSNSGGGALGLGIPS
jgi:hypothetical protein